VLITAPLPPAKGNSIGEWVAVAPAGALPGRLGIKKTGEFSNAFLGRITPPLTHVTCTWVLLYIERWLTAPMVQEDETRIERSRGTPQGGVVSPILSNLFLHYPFDLWMTRTHPDLPWCR